MKRLLQCMALFMLLGTHWAIAEGDASAGAEKSSLCASCHGADGNSAMSVWPNLAGQHEAYLVRQLQLIKNGERPVPQMAGITGLINEEDIQNLAAYYSEQQPRPGVADPAQVVLGERIYRAGNTKTSVPACMACHGPAGEGNPLSGYPALAGQHADYTASMLNRYRGGENWGEDDAPSKVMNGVASRLTDAEIKAVSSYIQGLYSKNLED